jgi:competence protein ComFC
MAAVNPQRINGKWLRGFALDVHTVSSTYLGVNEAGHEVYDTRRSELGELLYRLKYRGDRSVVPEIAAAAAPMIARSLSKFDIIVPVPPSGVRAVQPVILLAESIGAATRLPVVDCVSPSRATTPLKGVVDPDRRRELLAGLYVIDADKTRGKNVLLFDDLYRSGATMNAITALLLEAGGAASVRALTITRTRSNQ